MTLSSIQKSLIDTASKGVEKLNRMMNPVTRPVNVVITLELQVDVHVEEAEPETGYQGAVKYKLDDSKLAKQIDEKIMEALHYEMT